MALEMRSVCERCQAPLTQNGLAFICSYECTYCEECYAELEGICLNCRGELVRRPMRRVN
jgi:hypothetical protein